MALRVHPHGGFHLHVRKHGLAEQFRYPAADVRIGAVAGEDGREDLADSRNRWMGRIAQLILAVGSIAATWPPGRASRTISATTCAGSGTLTSRVRVCTRSNEPGGSHARAGTLPPRA